MKLILFGYWLFLIEMTKKLASSFLPEEPHKTEFEFLVERMSPESREELFYILEQ